MSIIRWNWYFLRGRILDRDRHVVLIIITAMASMAARLLIMHYLIITLWGSRRNKFTAREFLLKFTCWLPWPLFLISFKIHDLFSIVRVRYSQILAIWLAIDIAGLSVASNLRTLNIRVFIDIMFSCSVAMTDQSAYCFATMCVFVFICIRLLVVYRLFKFKNSLVNYLVAPIL